MSTFDQRNRDFSKGMTDAQFAFIEAERRVSELQTENAKLRESVRRLMTQRDERLATAEHKSNELSEGVSRHLLCTACLAPTRNAADSIIVRCRDCKHYTDHSINLHPHWCRKHGSYRISPDFFCAGGERRDVDA